MSESEESTAEISEFELLLQSKLKKLTPTVTKVTKPDGSVNLFENQGKVQVQQNTSESQPHAFSYGFVVDTKPDLTVGQVRPWLLVSSQDVASDSSLIKKLEITHILSLLPGFVLELDVKSRIIEHLAVKIFDDECFNIVNSTSVTLLALEFIRKVKDFEGGKVLVHCNAGISRAPSVVILYLMQFEGLSFEEAWGSVKSARICARPNKGFMSQMKEFGKSK